MSNEPEMKFREFVVRGKVYSGSRDHAKHTVYWSLNSEENGDIFLIEEIQVVDDDDN